MAQTAMTIVEKFFKMGDLDEAGIADMAEALLGPDEKTSCYYYRVPPNGSSPGKVRFQVFRDMI
jgi:hypothetical protein